MNEKKTLYQVYLILQSLPEEEYNLISKDDLEYIRDNMEIDDNFYIDATIPLENQNINNKTYDYLESLINKTNLNKQIDQEINFKNIIHSLKRRNEPSLKMLNSFENYQKSLLQKDSEIEELKQNNELLLNSINKLPPIIRKIFFKELNSKMLNSGKYKN